MGINPANQFMEQLIGIQPGWTYLTFLRSFQVLWLSGLYFAHWCWFFNSLSLRPFLHSLVWCRWSLSLSSLIRVSACGFCVCYLPYLYFSASLLHAADKKGKSLWKEQRQVRSRKKMLPRKLSWLEVFLCSQVIIIGAFGGVVSFLSAVTYIRFQQRRELWKRTVSGKWSSFHAMLQKWREHAEYRWIIDHATLNNGWKEKNR